MLDSEVKKNTGWIRKLYAIVTSKKICCLEESFAPPMARKSVRSSGYQRPKDGISFHQRRGPAVPVLSPGCEIWWCECGGNLGAETGGTWKQLKYLAVFGYSNKWRRTKIGWQYYYVFQRFTTNLDIVLFAAPLGMGGILTRLLLLQKSQCVNMRGRKLRKTNAKRAVLYDAFEVSYSRPRK